MYSPDTFHRLNERAVQRHNETILEQATRLADGEEVKDPIKCDFCNQLAVHHVPVYNPADSVRDVEGAYLEYALCDEHYHDGSYLEETFYCDGCGQLFVTHHSWDELVTIIDGGLYCQTCALEVIEPVSLADLYWRLITEDSVDGWHRINGAPGHKKLWSGEYSGYANFPGHTSLGSVADEIREAAEGRGLDLDKTMVIPLITQGYQFSVVLGVYLV